MFNIENFYAFLTVSLLVNISPGPDMIYTAARSLSQGIKAGIFSAMGIFAGCLFHLVAAIFGISKLIEESVLLFNIIKIAGAAYLVYLGIRSVLNRRELRTPDNLPLLSPARIFIQAMLTNLLNPKVAIFFLSFLPQFVDPSSIHVREQIAFLGLWFALQGTIILMVIAILAGAFSKIIIRNKGFWKWQERFTGVILIGLGIRMLFTRK